MNDEFQVLLPCWYGQRRWLLLYGGSCLLIVLGSPCFWGLRIVRGNGSATEIPILLG